MNSRDSRRRKTSVVCVIAQGLGDEMPVSVDGEQAQPVLHDADVQVHQTREPNGPFVVSVVLAQPDAVLDVDGIVGREVGGVG